MNLPKTSHIVTTAVATALTTIATAIVAVQTRGNQAKVDELLTHLHEVSRAIGELHL